MTAEARRSLPPLPPRDRIRRVHVIGICGTAMGTIAAMLKERGFAVSGSDVAAYPPMSDWLADRGLDILPGYQESNICADLDLVIVGNVARRDNPEAVAAQALGIPAISLPEALRVFFFAERTVLAVTGTHGKTTTTSMLAWLLYAAGRDPSFLVGGVTANFDSNYRLGDGDLFVIEGDEYDTAYFDKVPKFWHYPATHATINNIEYDHADIYPDMASIEHVFRRFAGQIPARGSLWVNGDDPRAKACSTGVAAKVRSFGLGADNALRGEIVALDSTGVLMDVFLNGEACGRATIPMIGAYNARNFLGACALALSVGVPVAESIEHIATFRGVKRRQNVMAEIDGVVVIDDFAHHPTAVRETLGAVREHYPEARIWAIFEAKSNTSRRAVFQDDYPPAFAAADRVVLSRPWKQDNLPEEQRISIPRVVDAIRDLGKEVDLISEVDDIVCQVADLARPGDVIVGLSGSNFGDLHAKLVAALRDRK